MENYEQERTMELAHYNEILKVIHQKLEDAETSRSQSAQALLETNRDMWENAPHSADDPDGAAGLSEFYQPLARGAFAVESSEKEIRLLERLGQSAYFARIDFRPAGQEQYEKIYIGKGTLSDLTGRRILIYDWRSPVAGLFYRFETGSAFYDAPGGRIAGEIGLKRQYEIKRGVFVYFFDADVQIADEFLRKMLSENTSGKMKTIVETIQKDQDAAIRDVTHDLLMVQGVAGSGKTSIALHRVAYLKYQGLSSRLSSSDILILSPNTLFGQYISNVLPELGEEEVRSVVFDDLTADCLPETCAFQSRFSQTEDLISCAPSAAKTLRKQAMEFKMSRAFGVILKRYADSLPTSYLVFPEIEYDGTVVFTGQALKDRLLQMSGDTGLAVKLSHLRRHIFDELHERRRARMPKLLRQARDDPAHPFDWEEYARELSIEESTLLAQTVDDSFKLDPVVLYKHLINTDGLLRSLSEGIELPDNLEELLSYSRKHLAGAALQNEDALAAAWLHLLIGAENRFRHVRQVVVDEAQDYCDLHFVILKRLFPNARYTLLGDFNQTIEKQETVHLYNRIAEILHPDSSCLMVMNKSFRCTREILSFSMQFLDAPPPFACFNRSGEPPQVIRAADSALLDGKLIGEVVCAQTHGYQSIGIICKDARESEALYSRLKDRISLHLVRPGEPLNAAGVWILPVALSKGLEFDSVLIYGTDKRHYHSSDDKRLLYIASTRALHRLNLFYTGEKSAFIQGGAGI